MANSAVSQWQVLKRDRWLLSSLTWIPILSALLIWWIFSYSLARDLPIAVVDFEQSHLSRQLIREFDATSSLKVARTYKDISFAKEALISKKIYGYVVIPTNFDRGIYLNNPPEVAVFYNSQFILVGKLINSSAQLVIGTFNAQIGIIKQLNKGDNTLSSAFAQAQTIRTQITPLFNKNTNYSQFLVSAIVPALWQISMVLSTILFLSANHRIYGLKKMFAQQPVYQFFSICAFYLPVFLAQGCAFLIWFYFNLDWPLSGSLLPLIWAQLITACSCIIMGSLFFLLTLDPVRAMSFSAAFTAPSFAFMGVTFPVTDMGPIAQFWRSLLPVSHYIEAQISQVSYGATAWQTIAQFTPTMLYYLLPLSLTLVLIKTQNRKLEKVDAPA